MVPLELVNHIRQCNMGEFRKRLEQLREVSEARYLVVEAFILSCKPDPRYVHVIPKKLHRVFHRK